MTTLRIFICSLSVFPATWASAQEPSVPDHQHASPRIHGAIVDAADSAAFGQFMRGLRSMDLGDPAQPKVSGYLLAWIVSEHGGIAVVTRGDGSAPVQRERLADPAWHELVLPISNCGWQGRVDHRIGHPVRDDLPHDVVLCGGVSSSGTWPEI